MYHGLVTTFTYIVILLDTHTHTHTHTHIYMVMYFSSPLSHMCCFFFPLFKHMFPLLYNLSTFHTWCLDGSCLSVSVKIGCKSLMPWSLFLQSFSRVCSNYKHRILYHLRLGLPFPNDAWTLRPKANLEPNQILNWLEEC